MKSGSRNGRELCFARDIGFKDCGLAMPFRASPGAGIAAAVSVAALAALCQGAAAAPALALFGEFERLVADAALDELHHSVRQAATALPLACQGPLLRHWGAAALVAAGQEG